MKADFLIIGSGMAGMSAAYRLSKYGKVIVLEKESLLGYHTTGRSAAFFTENYGNKIIRSITKASRHFLENPPSCFKNQELIPALDTCVSCEFPRNDVTITPL